MLMLVLVVVFSLPYFDVPDSVAHSLIYEFVFVPVVVVVVCVGISRSDLS